LSGLVIDNFAGRWLAQTKGDTLPDWLAGCAEEHACALWWKRLDQSVREPPVWVAGDRAESPFVMRENGVQFEIDFTAGYSQGIFLDQRLNRAEVMGRSRSDKTLLNLFAYTCAFSVMAAQGGAISTSLDLSGRYLDWGKRNFQLNGHDPDRHFFCKGDALSWLSRWAKSGRSFDGVIADPPTFSRNEKSKIWRVEKDYARLVELVAGVVAPNGWALFCTNFRGIDRDRFFREIESGVLSAGRVITAMKEAEMPPEYTGEQYLKSVWIDLE